MKFIITLFFAICFSINSYSQKCDFITNKVDEFTNSKILHTKPFNINKSFTSKYFFTFSLASVNGECFMFMQLTGGGQSLFIKQENALSIKLGDGEVISFHPTESTTTKFETLLGGVNVSRIMPKYAISTEDLKKILSSGISKIRMETSEHKYDSDVKPKDNANIKKTINCILSNK